ncbi:hypothetical protein [Endozoicomonas euniceicola]|uniref:Mor transcription activator domain-containing protein n=1 Tax=Endozoicomonas euniceicola TaxID=1234143 RepID=A0ABY6GNI5_9GAMM|nr:hypothetical protein [Endozoicomonas euniceicola]UYM14273.1 hypothetical protein NX720_15350 [Endozoicomonas euniceicola]
MDEQAPLPKSVQEVADVIGREKALKLAGRANGCVYVPHPQKITEAHFLSQVIGLEAALALSNEFRGIIIHLATCRFLYTAWRDRSIHRMRQNGMYIADIASLFGITPRHINNILNKPIKLENSPEEK